MGVREIADQLGRVPLFSACSQRELGIIARSAKVVRQKEGTVLAQEGDRGVGFFLISAGSADVTIGGKRRAKLGAGDFFGEISLLDGGPRTATVTATSDVDLIAITSWAFRGLLREHPQIALKMLETVAERLRRASKEPTA